MRIRKRFLLWISRIQLYFAKRNIRIVRQERDQLWNVDPSYIALQNARVDIYVSRANLWNARAAFVIEWAKRY